MTHTWQSNHAKKLELANVDGGDIALCGAFASRSPLLPEVDGDRISFVAPLESRSDLEWLLRGLHLHPHIGHVVLCGDDLRVTAESALALWRDGLDANGELPGGRGRLSAELDAEAIDALREHVKIWDWRGRSPAELAEATRDLPAQPAQREPRVLPDPEIPQRKVFMSRRTSFPIYANEVGDSWLQLLNLVLRIGTPRPAPCGEQLAEALNVVVTVGLPVIAEDLEVEVAPPEAFPSCFDMSPADFERFYRRFDPPGADREAAPCNDYGERLQGRGGVDQVEALCQRLKQDPDAQPATAIVADSTDLAGATHAPNTLSATFSIVDGSLYGSFVLRSVDVYSDWPLEAMALIRLHRAIAERLGLEAGATTLMIHSAQLFDRDWQRAEQRLADSFKRPLPLQVDHSGIFLFGNDGGRARAMLLDHEAGRIFWEDAFDSPIDLSWYIVDSMPWLLPQHFRYVGQECASLQRAMQEKECYLQG